MKKYVIAYIILFLILLGLGLTHGIPFGITIAELDFSFAIRPAILRHIVLIYNMIIMLACFVTTVILTSQKKNTLKRKWLIPVIMFICFVFLPVGMSVDIQIVPRVQTKKFWSFISLMMR